MQLVRGIHKQCGPIFRHFLLPLPLLSAFWTISTNGPYLLTSDDMCRNRTSLLVKFDANSSGMPLMMYVTCKRYEPMTDLEFLATPSPNCCTHGLWMAPNAKVSCDSNQATASRRVGARVCLSNSSSHRVEKRTNANLGVFQGPLNFCWKQFSKQQHYS